MNKGTNRLRDTLISLEYVEVYVIVRLCVIWSTEGLELSLDSMQ